MNPILYRSFLSDILELEAEGTHQVIKMRANNKTRLFCNSARCTYEDIIEDTEEIEIAVTVHESLNER